MTAKDPGDAINSYVTDMLALEHHISKALEGQVADLKNYPDLVGELKGLLGTVGGHISTLEMLAKANGGEGGASAIKKIGSALLGFGAAAVDLVRNEGMPKNLRDDYTACSLAAIGYTMLHTTAKSLGNSEVADVARRHLADYSRAIMVLNNLTPSATIAFLQQEGLPARDDVLTEVSNNLEQIWRESARSTPEADEMKVGGRR